MFGEYLDRHPMAELLLKEPPAPFLPADDSAWENLPQAYRDEILREADAYRPQPYPMRTAAGFLAFVRDGSRKADETPYFFRRRKLCWAALDARIRPEVGLDDVIDGIWCICEETTWVISAHNVNPIPGAPAPADYPLPDRSRPYIDLFSAQTGMILSMVARMLGPRLDAVSPEIVRRIREEVDSRILRPFMTHDEFWWMGFRRRDLNNWTPWILSNVIVCACLSPMDAAALAALLDRACRMLDRWLDVVPADGGCDEGAGYWNVAGGALLDCLEALEQLTGGRMTFWQEEKIRNILSFPLKAKVSDGWFVNFADCDARPFLSGERLQYAGERLCDPALVAMGARSRGTLAAQLNDVPHLTRLTSLLFHPAADTLPAAPPADSWLPDLQLRVVRRGRLTLCCKGGHNGESHNHNDIGSFMLYADGAPVVVDAGNMTYTAKTFSAQRYTLWNTRSAYHNVPLVGETEQCAGTEYAARDVCCRPDGLTLDLAGAYPPEAGLVSLRRELALTEDGLTVRDAVTLDTARPVTWVFMLRREPQAGPDALDLGPVRMALPDGFRCGIEEIPVTDARMAHSFPGSLWRVRLTAPAAAVHDITWRLTVCGAQRSKEEHHEL